MKFNSTQQEMVMNVFKSLNDSNINFVVLRGHQDLPERIPGGDIDLCIDSSDFENAVQIFGSKDIIPKRGGPVLKLANKVKQDPITAVRFFFSNPTSVPSKIKSTVSSEPEQLRKGLSEIKMYRDDIMFHCINHLAYISPMNGSKVRVDPQVEKYLFKDKIKMNEYFVPSHIDELLHLVCRGVFDYEGDFPEYYQTRCAELWERISKDPNGVDSLMERLSLIFYAADELVLEHIKASKYDQLRDSLRQFSEY